ncbi:MAG: flagellar biosynthesis protein FlhF [Pseudomonadales bacterium]|nr:flagellar biosynthesis protein FlhF [Pseudomonadales bacterium]
MNKVLAKIRSEMGSSAVLISSRSENGRTEVIAAQDYDPEKLDEALADLERRKQENDENPPPSLDLLWEVVDNEQEQKKQRGRGNENIQNSNFLATPIEVEKFESMAAEISRLRELFEGELAYASRNGNVPQPNEEELLDRLKAASLGEDLRQKIVNKALPCKTLETGWRRVQQILCRIIRISHEDIRQEGGVVALFGTSGVGKTATAAKIAAQFALRHGRNQIAFITTDTNRVGGQSQLIALGAVLGIPVQVLSSYKEIPDALASFAERKLVLIDTAGVNQRDSKGIAQLAEMVKRNPSIKPYLVLSANTQETIVADTLQAFAAIRLAGSIITKLDESSSLGPVLSGLIRHKLPIAFISRGQKVPEDLQRARISHFVNHIIQAYSASSNDDGAEAIATPQVASA